jgi:hypothetical protein
VSEKILPLDTSGRTPQKASMGLKEIMEPVGREIPEKMSHESTTGWLRKKPTC